MSRSKQPKPRKALGVDCAQAAASPASENVTRGNTQMNFERFSDVEIGLLLAVVLLLLTSGYPFRVGVWIGTMLGYAIIDTAAFLIRSF